MAVTSLIGCQGECTRVVETGSEACGNSVCDPAGGESKTSCPADCSPSVTGGECEADRDCIFLDW